MFRFLFFPISAFYSLILLIRRRVFFTYGIFKRTSFDIPIICIGNLSMGGTGKTPHTEYITRLFKKDYRIATLSRGYKRKTTGYICANNTHLVQDIGDEPMQYFHEFGNEVTIAVDERRVHGVKQLLNDNPTLDMIILDDAYQHLAIKAGLNILLTDYFKPYFSDYLFPVGTLRENQSAAKFADIVIVTKCPKILSPITRDFFLSKIKPTHKQQVFFSYFTYGNLVPITSFAMGKEIDFSKIILLTGIVNPYPLKEYLTEFYSDIRTIEFPDHHEFTPKDIAEIIREFDTIITKQKAIITTQKDAMRLLEPHIKNLIDHLPIFYVPLNVNFHEPYETQLIDKLNQFINPNK